MDRQNKRLRFLIADDEIGAYLQITMLMSEYMDESSRTELLRAINDPQFSTQISTIEKCTGVRIAPDTITSITRDVTPENFKNNYAFLQRYLGLVNKTVTSWDEELQSAEDHETQERLKGLIESAVKAQEATGKLRDTVAKAVEGMPFNITFCGTLKEALNALSKRKTHDFDVVITDWFFVGSGSDLGGLLVLLAADSNKEKNAYLEKGFYTGYAGILSGSLDAQYIKDYVLKKHRFEELDKFELIEGIKKLSENVAVTYLTSAPFATLEDAENGLRSAVCASDKVQAAEKKILLLNEQDEYEMTMYHLFPFLFRDAQEGLDINSRWNKILNAISQAKNQYAISIVKDSYKSARDFIHSDIQNILFTNHFNANICLTKWSDITGVVNRRCNDRMEAPETPIGCIKKELKAKFNGLHFALKSGDESNVCNKLLALKRGMRLRFAKKRQEDTTRCSKREDLSTISNRHLDYAHIEDLFPTQSFVRRENEPQGYSWIEFKTLKKGVELLLGEITARGGGMQKVFVRKAVQSCEGYAEVLIEQRKPEVTSVNESIGVAKAFKHLELFCHVIVAGKFKEEQKGYRFGESWITNIDELNIDLSNSAWWILRFPRGKE